MQSKFTFQRINRTKQRENYCDSLQNSFNEAPWMDRRLDCYYERLSMTRRRIEFGGKRGLGERV